MKIYFKIKDNKINDVKFQTFGCVSAIAASDALCELAKGKTLEEAKKITNKEIIDKLKGLPSIKVHCSVLGAEGLKKAIMNYEEKPGKQNIKINLKLTKEVKNKMPCGCCKKSLLKRKSNLILFCFLFIFKLTKNCWLLGQIIVIFHLTLSR